MKLDIKGVMQKDNRHVILKDDKYKIFIEQEQLYTKEQVNNMIKGWQEKLEQYNKWLENFDIILEDGAKSVKDQLLLQKQKVELDKKYLEEGIALWFNPQTE